MAQPWEREYLKDSNSTSSNDSLDSYLKSLGLNVSASQLSKSEQRKLERQRQQAIENERLMKGWRK